MDLDKLVSLGGILLGVILIIATILSITACIRCHKKRTVRKVHTNNSQRSSGKDKKNHHTASKKKSHAGRRHTQSQLANSYKRNPLTNTVYPLIPLLAETVRNKSITNQTNTTEKREESKTNPVNRRRLKESVVVANATISQSSKPDRNIYEVLKTNKETAETGTKLWSMIIFISCRRNANGTATPISCTFRSEL